MTKFQLMSMLCANGTTFSRVVSSGGVVYQGVVCAIEREDGSGSSFNVKLCLHEQVYVNVYVRTID